ncbi:hypothetical protein K440DRAFT_647294 [Wilcoxina mikolae CBS 423.85]|nr:hypothetical protein K440DRAFT_647294 [Wilcoxina mikolae CBS 423.85]
MSGGVFNRVLPEEGGADAKRRRIARACDMCRKKKIKCDGKLPACTHCVNYKTECVFTVVEKKRNPPKGAKYIEGLENRLGRMESLLKLSGLLPEGDENTDLGDLERRLQESANTSQRATSNVDRSSSESASGTPSSTTLQRHLNSPTVVKDEVEVETLSDQMCSLVTNGGETRFIGSSSGFSIFSPQGIQWVNEKTGDTSFQQMVHEAKLAQQRRPCSIWKSDTYSEIFDQRGRHPFPPRETASLLVRDFFRGFNMLFPLFHQPTFEAFFERQYSNDPPVNSGWYAAFNVVLAISCRLRVSHPPSHEPAAVPVGSHISEAWKYFQNAATVLTELLLRNSDLMSIQAILGMALFMQGTANPQPSCFLVAAAVRISTSIGMHRRGSSFGLSPTETQQRRRIFWILYILDKNMALRTGRPPCINDDDCNVELPDEHALDGIGEFPLNNSKAKFNLFRCMVNFAMIESKVYMQLYSAKASKQSDGELLNTIGDLDRELEEWKDSVPAEFSPDSDLSSIGHSEKFMHFMLVHFTYYNCLTTVHRMSIHHGYWTSRLSNYALAGLSAKPLNPRVFASAGICVSAARATINLTKRLDTKDYPYIWLILYFPISALMTLFANILQNPQDQNAKSDLNLMHSVVDFLNDVLARDENEETMKFQDGSIGRMLIVCGEFQRIAKVVLDKAEKEGQNKRKRKPEDASGLSRPRKRAEAQGPTLNNGISAMNAMGSGAAMNGMQGIDMNSQVRFPKHQRRFLSLTSVAQFYGGDLNQPFSPTQSLSWLNEIESSPETPPSIDHTLPSMAGNSFEQPFVPQDLWQMPMTFGWDWADVTGQMPWDGSQL